jgi:hypothetical protein
MSSKLAGVDEAFSTEPSPALRQARQAPAARGVERCPWSMADFSSQGKNLSIADTSKVSEEELRKIMDTSQNSRLHQVTFSRMPLQQGRLVDF